MSDMQQGALQKKIFSIYPPRLMSWLYKELYQYIVRYFVKHCIYSYIVDMSCVVDSANEIVNILADATNRCPLSKLLQVLLIRKV
jgi:hypothetical protein